MSSKLTTKIVSTVVSVATIVSLSGSSLLLPVASAQATSQSIQALIDQINALQSQLNGLLGTSGSTAAKCTFTRSLTVGSTGSDVMCLQKYLNGAGFKISATGAGSPGNESTYFGTKTKAAVAAWQAANGVSPAAGFFGSLSQAKYNAVAGGSTGTTPPGTNPPTAPMGSGLTVTSGAQIATGMLHPDNAVRVPYTAFVLTASSDGDVKVNSITAERQGASTDATFSGVVLLDAQGTQIGLEKTINSNHQVILNEPITIPAGQSRTYWIAANRTTGGSNGTQANFAVTGVSTSAAVNGSFPIVGTTRTMNVGGLSIGTATVSTGPTKSVATTTEDAGKTMVFTSIRVSAGSVEDINLKSVRFNQVGTVGTNDISGLEVKANGTVYPHTVSADGKYFTAVFGSGITVTKGNNVEITIGGTLAGGTNRTVKFDIYRMTDIAVEGKLFGYGINPTAGTGFTSTNPVYWASQVTVGRATMNVEKDSAISAQNIAVNLIDQPIGGFSVDVKGEPITVASMVFNLGITGGDDGSDITQIKLIGPNGQVVAGPIDGSDTSSLSTGSVTFTDTVTFPVGKNAYKLVGKLSTDFASNNTVAASTTPSSQWTSVTGQTTGETITPSPSSAVTGNTMTVKAGALVISTSPSPVAQTIVSGIQGFTFANYLLDAGQSGEDLRVSTIPLAYAAHGGATASNLTNCQLYDGAASVTTGSNVVNPSAQGSSTTFTFDGSGLTIPKGAVKTLALKCNVAGGATGAYSWGIDDAASFSATGLVSGQSLTPTATDADGQKITLSTGGSYAVTDDSTPGYRIVTAGATGVVLARLKFSATDEAVDVQRIHFQLTTNASNTPLDLVNQLVTLYDEAAPTVAIGTAQFGAGGTVGADLATSTIIASGALRIPAGGSKTVIVKGDIAGINTNGPLVRSGDLLKVDYDGTVNGISNGGNYGTGVSSGTSITPSSSDTTVQGVRVMKAYPVFTKLAIPSNLLKTQTNYTFYRFSVQAVGGDVRIAKFTFNISSSTGIAASSATTSKYSLYAYDDAAFSSADTTFSATGLLNASQCYGNGAGQNNGTIANTVGIAGNQDIEIFPDQAATACGTAHSTTTYKVPGGSTKYFDFRVDVASVESTTGSESMTVTLRGDAAFPTVFQNGANTTGDMGIAGHQGIGAVSVDSDSNDDFIWSPVSTSTSPTIRDLDFTNGYQVLGLPANDMPAETLTSAN